MVRRAAVELVGCAALFCAVVAVRAALAPAGWPVVEPLRAWPAGALLAGSWALASAALHRRPPVDRALGAVVLGAILSLAAVFLLRIGLNRSVFVPFTLASPLPMLFAARWAPVPWGPPEDPAWPELDPARMAKRAVDLCGAVVLGALALPLLLAFAPWIAADGGPVFFAQERVGRQGRRFRMWKLRTMVPDAEDRLGEVLAHNEVGGPAFKLRADPRVTRVGAWLRRSSLDELPQLWNVIRGEMSLVGPRPPLPREADALTPAQRRRLAVPQGMTGLWQVSGRADLPWERWVELDLAYVDGWTPWLDLRLLARTPAAVLRGTGAW